MFWTASRLSTGKISIHSNEISSAANIRRVHGRHNDFPMTLRSYARNQVANLDINDLTNQEPWSSSPSSHTDINRLRQGKVGAQVSGAKFIAPFCLFKGKVVQFWSAYVGCSTQYKDAMAKTWEQIDVVHRMVQANPETFEFVTSAAGTNS